MPHILFVAKKPEHKAGVPESNEIAQWRQFLNEVESKRDITAHAERLAENVWLIPLRGSLPTLSALVQEATQRVSYKALHIEGELKEL